MTNEQILKKAIEKAVKGGYPKDPFHLYDDKLIRTTLLGTRTYYADIFSHSFAKAFWGEELLRWGQTREEYIKEALGKHLYSKHSWAGEFWDREDKMVAWAFHLQQMVLEEEPLKYLERFL